jgi:poly(hydroxyalkanoate) depolymerase family esterase
MRKLNDTIARLGALRARTTATTPSDAQDRLEDLGGFGSNPGDLRARSYVPDGLRAGAALVVVLHGCTQTAAGYDRGSGWSQLAAEAGFAVLFPEQQRANNPNLCFNWYNPEDARRGSGEALSIRQMVAAMIAAHDLDPARVYVTGLSAGGAMTSVMLATYPEVFAGGAIIAGLPFGTASTVPEAFDRMRGHGGPDAAALGRLIRAASDHRGPWPTVSVWHGHSDATVSAANANMIVEQWRGVHELGEQPSLSETVEGYPRHVWRDAAGRDAIEEYRITGMGHGTPLKTAGEDGCGIAGPYMLEARISSTRRIASFWGVLAADESRVVAQAPAAQAASPAAPVTLREPARRTRKLEPVSRSATPPPAAAPSGVQKIIEDALRTAGLMR